MAGGSEISAVFRGLAEDAARAGENIGTSMSRFFEDTAEKEDASVATHMAAEEENTRAANAVRPGDENLPGGGAGGGSGAEGSNPVSRLLNRDAGAGGGNPVSRMLNGGADTESSSGEAADKKLPDYIQKRIDEGNAFNRENEPRYRPYNEIVLDSGKRVDSYVPDDEIIERKHTQLSDVKEDTAKGYIDSLRNKYKSGQLIKDSPRNRDLEIGGKKLKGEHVLEVPKQANPVPQPIIDHANAHNVTIRDVEGKEYN